MLRNFPLSLADLLDRPSQVVYGSAARELIRGRRVLVTGAAGSIGSEIVRQLDRLAPSEVFLVDHDETALHSLQLQRSGHGLLDDEHIVLGDIRDPELMCHLMSELAPSIVFHVAAHKHLPLLERYPMEAVKTNVLGTENVVAAAAAVGVERVINVSTDKAAAPTSVLGASKRLGERIVASFASPDTQVASVRFGNVLGSRGSLLHSLAWQIENDEPVTLTHRDATRFFMTIPEAASLVIEAAHLGRAGETFVLDMGEPVEIVHVIQRFAELCGLDQPRIVETGLRPGEKLHETLLDENERGRSTGHPKISVITSSEPAISTLRDDVSTLRAMSTAGLRDAASTAHVRALLSRMAAPLHEVAERELVASSV